MKFKKIKISNIRSYTSQELEFPDGSILLAGDVGSGKTSILLALEYALFGLQPGQKGASLLKNGKNIGAVSLELETEDKTVVIERKLKRTQKGISNEYASITINGEKFESSVTEIKSRIVSLLGYPEEFVKKNNLLYRYTVYTPQEKMKQIVLEDPETRLNILRHIFGVDKYRQIKNNLSVLLMTLKNSSKYFQAEIKTIDEDKESLALRISNLSEINQKITKQEDDLTERIKIREFLEKEIEEIEDKIESKRNFETEIEKTKILLSTKRENISSINNEEMELESTLQNLSKKFSKEEYSSLIREISLKKDKANNLSSIYQNCTGTINSLEKEIKEILLKKERIFKIDICPTCLQDVSETHKHNILNETENKLSGIKREISPLQKEQSICFEELEILKKEINKIEEERISMEILKSKTEDVEVSRRKLNEIKNKKSELTKDITLLTNHLEGLKERIFEYSVFELKFRKKEAELKNAELEERKSEIYLAELNKELELSNREINFLKITIKKKEETKKKLADLENLIDWLSTNFLKLINLIEHNVLLKLRKEFSMLFRKWFHILVSDDSLTSQIDENFTPIILQRDAEMDYSFLSGGERTAVALAYRLALNQTINSIMSKIKTKGIIILDEPTDGFSDTQINKIREILEELNTKQLIIVSHEQKIEGFVDNVLKVTKNGETSQIAAGAP